MLYLKRVKKGAREQSTWERRIETNGEWRRDVIVGVGSAAWDYNWIWGLLGFGKIEERMNVVEVLRFQST